MLTTILLLPRVFNVGFWCAPAVKPHRVSRATACLPIFVAGLLDDEGMLGVDACGRVASRKRVSWRVTPRHLQGG